MAATRLNEAPPMAAATAVPATVESWSDDASEDAHSARPASPPSAPAGMLSHHFPWSEACSVATPRPVIAPTNIAM